MIPIRKSRIYKPCRWWVVEHDEPSGNHVFSTCIDFARALRFLFTGDLTCVVRQTSRERP